MAITKVNLKLLQTFLLVAEHGSFREAADKVFRSQSAISTQIKQLEAQIGTPLFHRTTRRVRLTPDGELLLTRSRTALEQVGEALREIEESVSRRTHRVVAGCSLWIASACLGDVLCDFEHEHPDTPVSVRERRSEELLDGIRSGNIEFAAAAASSHDELDFEPIFSEDFYAIASTKLTGTGRSSITLPELSRLPVLLRDQRSTQRGLIDHAMEENNLSFHTRYEAWQAQTVISMAMAGLGVAILPKSALLNENVNGLNALRIVEPTISRQVGIVKMRGQALSPPASRLAELFSLRIQPLQRLQLPM